MSNRHTRGKLEGYTDKLSQIHHISGLQNVLLKYSDTIKN